MKALLFAHLKRILKLYRLRLRGPNGARDEFRQICTQSLDGLASSWASASKVYLSTKWYNSLPPLLHRNFCLLFRQCRSYTAFT